MICRSGYRASAALQQLEALGFTALSNVQDGMLGWQQNHLPVERSVDPGDGVAAGGLQRVGNGTWSFLSRRPPGPRIPGRQSLSACDSGPSVL